MRSNVVSRSFDGWAQPPTTPVRLPPTPRPRYAPIRSDIGPVWFVAPSWAACRDSCVVAQAGNSSGSNIPTQSDAFEALPSASRTKEAAAACSDAHARRPPVRRGSTDCPSDLAFASLHHERPHETLDDEVPPAHYVGSPPVRPSPSGGASPWNRVAPLQRDEQK